MVKILNLDNLVPEDKKIIIKGKEIIVPGDISVEYMFRSMRNSQLLQENPNDVQAAEDAFDSLYELISPRNEGLDKVEFRKMITSRQYIEIIRYLNEQYTDGTEKKTSESSDVTNR